MVIFGKIQNAIFPFAFYYSKMSGHFDGYLYCKMLILERDKW